MSFKALLEDHAPGRPTVVTVGTFDGVHHGHRKILSRTVEIAHESGPHVASVAIMFRKPPRALIMPNAEMSFLCPLQTRERLIRDTGIDTIIPVDFDEDVYGRTVSLEFARRLRPEQKFDTVQELTAQMDVDVEKTREILSSDRSASTAR